MKQFLYPFYALLLLIFSVSSATAQGYQVTLEAPAYNSGTAYLIYYFGKSMNIQDSGIVNSKGEIIFHKDEKLLPGVYSIVFPGKNKLYDFLVDKEQKITIKADTSDLINKSVVIGSSENDLFVKYQQFTALMSPLLQKEIDGYNAAKTKTDSLLHQKKYIELNDKMNVYRKNIIKDFPNSMLASLFLGMQDATVENLHPTSHKDTLENYQYYKKHYWDGVTFMDDRIIRTPFFLPKLERYFRDVISPAPDSIIKEADYLLLLARSAPEMYKFLLNWLTDEYMNPKYMGQDAVLVHLFEKYHSKGISNWLNEKQLTAISNKAYMVMSNLIGEKAANLEMVNEKEKPTNLYSLNAKYTVVCFWDPTCSHCRVEIPRMDSIYNAKWKQQGVQIFAVLTESKEKEKWVEFINTHHLQNWTNVYETEQKRQEIISQKKPSYQQLYNVTQTPTLYLLDKDKRIIAKQLSLEQMDEVLQTKIKNKVQ